MRRINRELFSFVTLQAFIWAVLFSFITVSGWIITEFLGRGWQQLVLLVFISLASGHFCEKRLKPTLMKWLNLRG